MDTQLILWLPVRYRILIFKIILLLTFKALNGKAQAYISDLVNVREHTRYSLRSNSGTTLWNLLPESPRNTSSILTFKSCLKIYLSKFSF